MRQIMFHSVRSKALWGGLKHTLRQITNHSRRHANRYLAYRRGQSVLGLHDYGGPTR